MKYLMVFLILVCFLISTAVAFAEESYVDNGDGTVTDESTGLMWQQADDGVRRKWKEACQYCEDLQESGYDDWRTPRIDELRTIVDSDKYRPAIDSVFSSSSSCYWSGSTGDNGTDGAWYVHFLDGHMYRYSKSDAHYVRCVRSGPSESFDPYSNSGTLQWSYTLGSNIDSSPAIGSDGTIYVGSQGGNLYAINPDGTLKWSYKTGGEIIWSSPAIGSDGTIYVGSEDNNLYAINPDGTLKWSYETEGYIHSSPAISSDGTIYVGSHDTYLYAINSDGTLKWRYRAAEHYINSSPAIGADGTIYVGSGTGFGPKLYAIKSDGTLKWTYETDDGHLIASSPAIGTDGAVYLYSNNGTLYAINPTGTLKWGCEINSGVDSSPAIGLDGTIYVGAEDNHLYAINSDGTIKWSYGTGGWIQNSSPAIGADGTVYVGSRDNNLYAINSDGTLKWSYLTGGWIRSSPAIGVDGTIYVGSIDNNLYAINGDSGGLTNSAWPMFHHNLRHTGQSIDDAWEPDFQENVFVLTDSSPDAIIETGSAAQIYGTEIPNYITLQSGAVVQLINFPGNNTIMVESTSSLFTVSRSGSVVTFQGSDETILKIPATKDVQTISFNGEESRVLQIYNNQVMLDEQVISPTPASIEGN